MTGADIASAATIRPIRSDSLIVDVLADLNKVVAAVDCPEDCEIYWDFAHHGAASDVWPVGTIACFVREGTESPIVELGVISRETVLGRRFGYRRISALKPLGGEDRPFAHKLCQAVTDAICKAEY